MTGSAKATSALTDLRDRVRGMGGGGQVVRRVLATATAVVVLQSALVGLGGLRAQQEANAASHETLAFVVDSVRARADSYISPARTTAHAAAYTIANGNLEVETDRLPAILYRHLLRAPQLTGIHVVTPDGVSVEIWRDGDGYRSRVIGQGADPFDVVRGHTAMFEQLTEQDTAGADDPRSEAIYQQTLDSTAPQWTKPHASPMSGLATISVAEVARSQVNAPVAVVWVDVALEGLAETLSDVPIGDGGIAAVLDGAGAVVVASRAGAPAAEATQFGITASDLGLNVGDLLGAGEVRRLVASTSSVLAEEVRLQSPGGPDWIIHVEASPNSLSPGTAGLSTALRTLATVSLLVVLLGLAVGWWTTRPLRELTRQATRDGLTGISNRADALARGAAELSAARSSGLVACVMLCDLDNFKGINDTLGHSAGDEALVAVAHALELEMRTGDVVGRWGGDEFMAVVTLPASADARRVVERIREGAEIALRHTVGARLNVGVTVGYADSAQFSGDVREMLDAADAALITGKRLAKSSAYAATPPLVSDGAANDHDRATVLP